MALVYDDLNDKQNAYDTYAKAIQVLETRIRAFCSVDSRIALSGAWAKLYHKMVAVCIALDKMEAALQYAERGKSRTFVEMLYAKGGIKPLSLAEITALIPEKTVFIEFYTTDKSAYIFVLDAKSNTTCLILKELNIVELFVDIGLENWIYPYNDYKDEKITKEEWFQTFDNTLALLAEKLWYAEDENGNSLDSLAEQSNAEHILFVPHIELSVLPLHLIPLKSGKRLLDKYDISYAPSFAALAYLQKRPRHPSDKLFAVADPDRSLSFADHEVKGLFKYFNDRYILWYEYAIINAVLNHAKNGNILHFACHGEFNLEDPFESELLLAYGEKLTLREIFLELKLPKANLVILSACETGISQIEPGGEYIALPAGFLFAGANAVISSLWAVDDFSTSLLMQKFYDNILGKNQTCGVSETPQVSSSGMGKAVSSLMQKFYDNILGKNQTCGVSETPQVLSSGMGKAAALRDAQQYVRDISKKEIESLLRKLAEDTKRQMSSQQERNIRDSLEKRRNRLLIEYGKYSDKPDDYKPFEHPYYWGAFVCNGNWN